MTGPTSSSSSATTPSSTTAGASDGATDGATSAATPGTLARTLREIDITLLFIGIVIGSGIFIVPATVLRQVDGAFGLALLVWVAGGALSLLGALTFAELGALNPKAGGLYVYIRECFGPFPAFLYGWTLFFLISSSSIATLAVAFSAYLNTIVPLSWAMGKLVAVLLIVAIAVVNVLSTRHSADLQNWTTAIKVAGILVMSAVLIGFGGELPPLVLTAPGSELSTASLLAGVGFSMIGVLWAYEGWQYATFNAGETINPQQALPRAFFIGSATLITVYLIANVGYVSALGADGARNTTSIAATAVAVVAGPAAAKLVALIILISIGSAANSLVLTSPRVYYAMARDGLFFARLAEVHPRFGTPAIAVVGGSAWAILLALSGTFDQLLTFVVFAGWLFYGLAAGSIFVYRRRSATRPFSVPAYPLTPILFIAASAAVVASTLALEPVRGAIGVGIVLLGAPAYLIWRPRGSARPAR